MAMEAAYTDGGPWLQAVLAYLTGNVELVRERLGRLLGVELIEPQGTFLVWLDFRKLGLVPEDLAVFLREQANWAVTRGESFGVEGAGFARLNIACTRAKLDVALSQLDRAITTL